MADHVNEYGKTDTHACRPSLQYSAMCTTLYIQQVHTTIRKSLKLSFSSNGWQSVTRMTNSNLNNIFEKHNQFDILPSLFQSIGQEDKRFKMLDTLL